MPARGQTEAVTDGLEAAQAWLADVWQAFQEGGRDGLAARTWAIIAEIEELSADCKQPTARGLQTA
jgi:hypothetical protein